VLEAFPKLKAWKERVAARPKIAAYLGSEEFGKLMKFGAIV
jgi:glutathione S-transferase